MYAAHDLPFFDLFEEDPSGAHGDFECVKSVNEIDHEKDDAETKEARLQVDESFKNSVILLDRDCPRRAFRHVSDLISESNAWHAMHSKDKVPLHRGTRERKWSEENDSIDNVEEGGISSSAVRGSE